MRAPMPITENRDYLFTEEFTAVMVVDPQSIRKRYSVDGSYHGVRPTKLASRRVLRPVEAVRRLRKGDLGDRVVSAKVPQPTRQLFE